MSRAGLEPAAPACNCALAADLLLAELKQVEGLANLKPLDNAPTRVAGKPGFRLHGQYRDERRDLGLGHAFLPRRRATGR